MLVDVISQHVVGHMRSVEEILLKRFVQMNSLIENLGNQGHVDVLALDLD